ncbi:MAG: hypothetical protein ACLQQ4_03650 [Bacteroidia bacterium]
MNLSIKFIFITTLIIILPTQPVTAQYNPANDSHCTLIKFTNGDSIYGRIEAITPDYLEYINCDGNSTKVNYINRSKVYSIRHSDNSTMIITKTEDSSTNVNNNYDSAFKMRVMIEINPTSMLTGEEGIYLKVQSVKEFYFMLGAGYNGYLASSSESNGQLGNSGYGYTIHGSIMFPIISSNQTMSREGVIFPASSDKGFSIGIQGFYRCWQITHAIGTDAANVYDYYINFIDAISDIDEMQQIYAYNASINVFNIDAVFDKEIIKNHFVFDFFGGFGYRFKTINLEDVGSYPSINQLTPFTPVSSPSFTNQTQDFFDIKLGIMLGYKF